MYMYILIFVSFLRTNIERTEMILPGNMVHVDMRGMVLVTEDFMVLTKWNTSLD